MKSLKIEYNGTVLFDGDVASMSWSEDENTISVKASQKASKGLGDLLTGLAGNGQQKIAVALPEARQTGITPTQNRGIPRGKS